MHIILHQPEIPANTGNIGRTCVATGTSLHLIEPLGFRLNEKEIKRAGMDYWQHLDVNRYVNFQEFQEKHPGAKIWMATTKAKHVYTEVAFGPDDYIMFGRESAGIPEEILVDHEDTCIRIPMLPAIRSLNLSNSVAIVLYEALRQQGFGDMQREGELHHLQWKTAPKIKSIIFDIGNVLSDFRWREFLMDKGFTQEMADRIGKATVQSPIWSEFDRSEWTNEQIMEAFIQNDPDIAEQIKEAFADIDDLVIIRDYTIPWIRELREKGYRVFYLSNYSGRMKAECPQLLEFTAYTDGGILSCDELLVKPDERLYRLLLERYGLKAEESVFLDDSLQNVETARKLGMYGICFQSREQAIEELQRLGVDC